MGDDEEHQRILRAEARRGRMTLVRAQLGDEPSAPGTFGLEGMILAAKLSFAAAAFAGHPVARASRASRASIEVRWVPSR